jgi:hypothetical protein
MAATVIVFAAAFVLGVMTGIVIGWSAAPAVIWRAPKTPPEEPVAPAAVGIPARL